MKWVLFAVSAWWFGCAIAQFAEWFGPMNWNWMFGDLFMALAFAIFGSLVARRETKAKAEAEAQRVADEANREWKRMMGDRSRFLKG